MRGRRGKVRLTGTIDFDDSKKGLEDTTKTFTSKHTSLWRSEVILLVNAPAAR